MRSHVSLSLCLAALMAASGGCEVVRHLAVTKGGETAYRVVVPADADAGTRAVAEDFARHLTQITGAEFPVVTDEEDATDHEIIVGEGNARLEEFGIWGLTEGFAQGEYAIRTIRNPAGTIHYIVIAGGPPRGTINGMYGFLRDHLGCRWFTPGVSRIPKKKSFWLADVNERKKPAFVYRATNPPGHWDGAWTARNRLNEAQTHGGAASLNALMSDARVATIGNYWSAHKFTYIPDALFEEHPEYYAEKDGKRFRDPSRGRRAYCLTNDGFVRYVADWLKGQFKSDPNRRFASVTQVDYPSYCECAKCKSSYDRVGTSGTFMEFVNRVADVVVEDTPRAIINTLAYQITWKPSPVEMHPNVRVVWCPIGHCCMHGLGECESNTGRNFLPQLAEWQTKCGHMGVWYYHYQSDTLMPHKNIFAARESLREFRRMGVKSVFVQDNCNQSLRTNDAPDGDKLIPAYGDSDGNGYFTVPLGLEHVRSYVVAQLLWDPDFDIKKGIKEFCKTYYGPADKELARFVMMCEDDRSYERSVARFAYKPAAGMHAGIGRAPMPAWPAVVKMDELFDRAEEKVAGDPALLRRVEMARLSLELAILCYANADDPLRQKAFDSFFALTEELGLKELMRTPVTTGRVSIAQFKELMSVPAQLSAPPDAENLLVNASFQTAADEGPLPEGWSSEWTTVPEGYAADPSGVALDATMAHSGQTSVRLTKARDAGKVVGIRQAFDAQADAWYRVSVACKSQIKKGRLLVVLSGAGKDGKDLFHQAIARAPGRTGKDWETLVVDSRAMEGRLKMVVTILFMDDQAEGTAWVDDVRCVKLE